MDELKLNIKRGSSKYNILDKAYSRFITNLLMNCDDNEIEKWNTYTTIIEDLITMGKNEYFEEIKYRITGNENMNNIILDIINKDQETKSFLKKHKSTIEYYLDIELISKFCK